MVKKLVSTIMSCKNPTHFNTCIDWIGSLLGNKMISNDTYDVLWEVIVYMNKEFKYKYLVIKKESIDNNN